MTFSAKVKSKENNDLLVASNKFNNSNVRIHWTRERVFHFYLPGVATRRFSVFCCLQVYYLLGQLKNPTRYENLEYCL